MKKMFDKDRLFRNINFLLKQQDKKISWLEDQAGVSAGYISRASKETTAKPGIDFITKVASLLNVSLDTLIYTDLAELTPTEKYLCDFFVKLIAETDSDMVKWNMELADLFTTKTSDDAGEDVCNPLIKKEVFLLPTDIEMESVVTDYIFDSFNFGKKNSIVGNCYNFELDIDLTLYIMSIKGNDSSGNSMKYAKEVWVYSKKEKPQFLCDNLGCKSLASVVDDLYSAAADAAKRPILRSDIHSAIDDFMQMFGSCNNDDEGGQLPF